MSTDPTHTPVATLEDDGWYGECTGCTWAVYRLPGRAFVTDAHERHHRTEEP